MWSGSSFVQMQLMYHSIMTTLVLPSVCHMHAPAQKVPDNLACIEPLRLRASQPAHRLSSIPLIPFHRIWANEIFEIHGLLRRWRRCSGLGRFNYRSRSLGRASVSPFSICCNVNEDSNIAYMQFIEDTLGSTDSFKKGGQKQREGRAEI